MNSTARFLFLLSGCVFLLFGRHVFAAGGFVRHEDGRLENGGEVVLGLMQGLSLQFAVEGGKLVRPIVRERYRSNDDGCIILTLTKNSSTRSQAATLIVDNFTGDTITIMGTARYPGQSQPSPFTLECKVGVDHPRSPGSTEKNFNRAVSEIRVTSFSLNPVKAK